MKSDNAETDRIRRELARERVRRAMAHVEDAQRKLTFAMSDLATVQHGSPEHGRIGKLYDKVKGEWYRLQDLFNDPRIRIDRDPNAEERERHAKASS